ncbi:4a-hydroxytetrahydrobiopterin dehydratase [Candidatus Dependentiae bacterium]|jgi:4a-hydroxytetrahydrobiopterin dehydratase|nr:4a-hydroxytetrahydrobiopterin dehydratase [Candidatus Dependentiae bacterium]
MNILSLCIIISLLLSSEKTVLGNQQSSNKKHDKIDLTTIRLGELEDGFCIPCHGGIKPLSPDEENDLLKQIKGWNIHRNDSKPHSIVREYNFASFSETIKFLNQVAVVSEREKHHPDIYLSYTRLRLELHTHAIKGLSLNDYVLAAKINKLKPVLGQQRVERPSTNIRSHRIKQSQIQENLAQLMKWKVKKTTHPQLTRETSWKNFAQAMEFANLLAHYIDEVKYYPEIYIFYNKVNLELYEHPKSSSLEGPDFIVARSINLIIDRVWQKFHTRASEPQYKGLLSQ